MGFTPWAAQQNGSGKETFFFRTILHCTMHTHTHTVTREKHPVYHIWYSHLTIVPDCIKDLKRKEKLICCYKKTEKLCNMWCLDLHLCFILCQPLPVMVGWERGKSLSRCRNGCRRAPPNPQTPEITTWNNMQDPFNSEEKQEPRVSTQRESRSTCIN